MTKPKLYEYRLTRLDNMHRRVWRDWVGYEKNLPEGWEVFSSQLFSPNNLNQESP